MKQLLLALAIVMGVSLTAYAQNDYDREDKAEAQGVNRAPAAMPSDVRAVEEREQHMVDRERRIKEYIAVTGNSREEFEQQERLAAAREAARKESEYREHLEKESRERTESRENREPHISSSADKPEKN